MKPKPIRDRIGLTHANRFAMWSWYCCFIIQFVAGNFVRPWDFVIAGLPPLFLSYLGTRASQDQDDLDTTRFLFRTGRYVQTILMLGGIGLVVGLIWLADYQIKSNDVGYINYFMTSCAASITGVILATFGALVEPKNTPTPPSDPKIRPAPIDPKLPNLDGTRTLNLPPRQ